MKEKSSIWLPIALMVTFALTRWPGLLPPNFSAAYALVFCAGVYLPGRMSWWLPLGTMLVTDIVLNLYYRFGLGIDAFNAAQFLNYGVYALIIWMGRLFKLTASFLKLLGGGLAGAVLFYLLTNTAAWLFNPFGNPEYTRTFAGWFRALTQGTAGYAQTWEFFRNTLASGGLFTGLFVGAMKAVEATQSESSREKNSEDADAPGGSAEGQGPEPEADAEEALRPGSGQAKAN